MKLLCMCDIWQDPNYQKGKFSVLHVDVDDDCMRLSKFVETKLNCQYEDGKAFYEVRENEESTEKEEDLLYYKKILCPKENEVLIKFYNAVLVT